MKKAKFLIYAAVAATAAIVSSCSNEDVVEQTPQKGRPIVVEASVDGDSRASVATSFTGFKLYGYDQANEGAQFLNGVGFANSGTAWTSVGAANWPTGTGACDFYAISVDGAAPTALPDNIDITDLATGSFAYTVPTDVADQQDLLVAKQNDVAYADNAGKIKLGFKHALANVTMQVRFNFTENNNPVVSEDISECLFSFDRIKIHNVYTSGTYNASTGVWTPTGELGTITLNFPQAPVYKAYDADEDIYKTGIKYQDIVLGSAGASLMVMPQTFESYWVNNDPKDNPVPVANAEAAHQPYIEIHGVVYTTSSTTENDTPFNYTPEQLADDEGVGALFDVLIGEDEYLAQNIYIPLKSPFVFGVNKNYNLRLNILGAFAEDGTTAFTPVEAAGGDNP
ncbi:MAG: fimbrillin family protein [Prevotella sp.]|nr:fimbrillin family protein [Prevotella sp.]